MAEFIHGRHEPSLFEGSCTLYLLTLEKQLQAFFRFAFVWRASIQPQVVVDIQMSVLYQTGVGLSPPCPPLPPVTKTLNWD